MLREAGHTGISAGSFCNSMKKSKTVRWNNMIGFVHDNPYKILSPPPFWPPRPCCEALLGNEEGEAKKKGSKEIFTWITIIARVTSGYESEQW
jgi:hypothetical protein